MTRPNAIMFVNGISEQKWICVYIKNTVGEYIGPIGQKYIKTTDILNLDPFENWLDYIPGKEWVYPIIAEPDGNEGWYFRPFDTYNEVRWNNKSTTLDKLNEDNNLFLFFDTVLDYYKNITDEKLEEELRYSHIPN